MDLGGWRLERSGTEAGDLRISGLRISGPQNLRTPDLRISGSQDLRTPDLRI